MSTRRSTEDSLAAVLVDARDSRARLRSHPPNCPSTFLSRRLSDRRLPPHLEVFAPNVLGTTFGWRPYTTRFWAQPKLNRLRTPSLATLCGVPCADGNLRDRSLEAVTSSDCHRESGCITNSATGTARSTHYPDLPTRRSLRVNDRARFLWPEGAVPFLQCGS